MKYPSPFNCTFFTVTQAAKFSWFHFWRKYCGSPLFWKVHSWAIAIQLTLICLRTICFTVYLWVAATDRDYAKIGTVYWCVHNNYFSLLCQVVKALNRTLIYFVCWTRPAIASKQLIVCIHSNFVTDALCCLLVHFVLLLINVKINFQIKMTKTTRPKIISYKIKWFVYVECSRVSFAP